jgi:hypothetical protein
MRILVMVVSGGDLMPYSKDLNTLQEFMKTHYSQDTVDYACITSSASNSICNDSIQFKYTEINSNMQLSKVCDFLTKYKDQLNYDWFIKIRPEIQLFAKIDIDTLSNDCIHARAREYRGPRRILYGNSLSGEGEHNSVNASFYSDIEDIIALDDQIYIFHRNIIDMGGFVPFQTNELEREWIHSNCWKSRGIKLNVIGINAILTRKDKDGIPYMYMKSGNINM